MRRAATLSLIFVGVLTLALVGCTSGSAPTDKEVVASLTDEVVVPTYESIVPAMVQLDQDAQALCNAPGASSLDAVRQSWSNARALWVSSEAMWFGPFMDRRSKRLVDWSPTDVMGIDALLAEGRVLTGFEVREILASNLRGFGAIEYLLFRDDSLASPNRADSHCTYLTGLTEVVRDETGAVLSEWTEGVEGGVAYRDYFTDNAPISILSEAAVAEVVRTQVFLIRAIVDMQLAAAMGLRGDAPDLTAIPGTAADNGLQDLRGRILGMQALYEGSGEEGMGISELVHPLSEETDLRLRDQFAAAIAAIDAVEGPLRAAIQERPDQVRNLHESLQNLQVTISTEVVGLLGVSVGFSDTDGDSLR